MVLEKITVLGGAFYKKCTFRIPFRMYFNALTTSVPYQIETSQLICINQLTGFYMMGNIGR